MKSEQNKLKEKLDHLFDLGLDGELDRATFDTKRNEIKLNFPFNEFTKTKILEKNTTGLHK